VVNLKKEGAEIMETTKSYNVYYFEDDPEMIDLVNMILSRHGYHVKGSAGGAMGLETVQKEAPDLILLDLMMPGMDGWDIYHQLKSEASTKDIPVIVVTARAQPIDRVLGLHIAKVDGYVCKPFHPQELLNSIEQVLEGKGSPQEL
jgi:DNA-binding response OmpR family regulator